MLAESVYLFLLGGLSTGTIATVLGLTAQRSRHQFTAAAAFGLVTVAFALIAPTLFALGLPGAMGADSPGHPPSGPWASFSGSGSNVIPPVLESATWGPAVGWYLCIVALVSVAIGVILISRTRQQPKQDRGKD